MTPIITSIPGITFTSLDVHEVELNAAAIMQSGPARPFPRHKGELFTSTACLCACHYQNDTCDDKVCKAVTTWEEAAK